MIKPIARSLKHAQMIAEFAENNGMSTDDLTNAVSLIKRMRFQDKVKTFDQRFAYMEKRIRRIGPFGY
ncbi:MAG: hypothetical protein K0S80_2953 [Neobacillus sp.]|jgi:hypothetical protein|nr:hypothetical protein [Neobacillus sp.]